MLFASRPDFISLLVCLSLVLPGCVTAPSQKTFVPSTSMRKIEVVLGEFGTNEIQVTNADSTSKALQGGLAGAAPGAAGMVAFAPLCSNPYTMGACVVFMPVFAVIAAAGGALGAAHEKSAVNMQTEAQQTIARTFKVENLQRSLLSHVLEYAGHSSNRVFISPTDARAQAGQDTLPDARLEIAMTGVDGIEVQAGLWELLSTHYVLILEARARLTQNSGTTVVLDRTYRYVSAPGSKQEWSSNDGQKLLSEMDQGYSQISEWVIDDFFRGRIGPEKVEMPKPVEAPVRFRVFGTMTQSGMLFPSEIRTITPTFAWDYKNAPALNADPDIRYDLLVYSAEKIGRDIWATSPFYSRNQLTGRTHPIEEDLLPCSLYLWTVRAEVERQGERQVSEWSSVTPVSVIDHLRQAERKITHGSLVDSGKTMALNQRVANLWYPIATPCNKKEAGSSLFLPVPHETTTERAILTAQSQSAPASASSVPLKHSVGASIISKALKTEGLSGFAKGIEIRIRLINHTDQDLPRMRVKAKLHAESGADLGTLNFSTEQKLEKYGTLDIMKVVYPVFFASYNTLRDIEQEKLQAEFEYQPLSSDAAVAP